MKLIWKIETANETASKLLLCRAETANEILAV